jgi:hypothetical protein
MPQPRQPLCSKSRNRDVAKLMILDDVAGTDLFEVVLAIALRARDLQQE